MVYIATCLQELLPFVHEHSPFLSFDRNVMELGHIISTIISSSLIMVYIAPCLQEFLPFVREKLPFFKFSGL